MQGNSAIIGMLGGAVTVIIWEIAGHYFNGIFKLYSIIPGFLVNTLFIIVFSKTKKTNVNSVAQFEEMKKTLHQMCEL